MSERTSHSRGSYQDAKFLQGTLQMSSLQIWPLFNGINKKLKSLNVRSSEIALKKHRILEDHLKMRCFFRAILDTHRPFWLDQSLMSFPQQMEHEAEIPKKCLKNIAKFKHEEIYDLILKLEVATTGNFVTNYRHLVTFGSPKHVICRG